VVGRGVDTVSVGVVEAQKGKISRKIMAQSWPIGSHSQDSFCAKPTHISLYPLNCKTENGNLPGCESIKGCYSFAVEDDECDPFNFYWDNKKHSLVLWRN
jgi:hypothetical protein